MAAKAFLHSLTGFGKSLVSSEAVCGELASSVAPHHTNRLIMKKYDWSALKVTDRGLESKSIYLPFAATAALEKRCKSRETHKNSEICENITDHITE